MTRGLIESSSAASFCTQFDILSASMSAWRSMSSSGIPVVKIPPTGIPLEDIERHAIVEALKMSNWVQKDAAELLSIGPRVMNYKIKTLGIEFPRGRRAAPLQPQQPPPQPPVAAAS